MWKLLGWRDGLILDSRGVGDQANRDADHGNVIYTVGYEGRMVDDLLAVLGGRNVSVLIDARYRAQSRNQASPRRAWRVP